MDLNLVQLQNFLDNLSFVLLFISMLCYWTGVAFPPLQLLPKLGSITTTVANITIAFLLLARWIEGGYFPISNLYESLFFLAWGLTAVHLMAERMLAKEYSLLPGVVTAPVGMAITAFATLSLPPEMQNSQPLVPALKSNWLMMHVSVMMLSYAALMVGSLLALTFLILTHGKEVPLRGSSVGTGAYRSVKKKSSPHSVTLENTEEVTGNGPVTKVVLREKTETLSPERLSLAETLDNISYRIIGLGFPLLTIGIISGAVWANEAWGSYWSWDPKETWALITWLVFAAYLHARITRGWQGKKPAIIASCGFFVVWICYLGVNLLGRGLHSYGWFF
ncbi:MAG: c-type cytochrome biogenesis protein CcsB [Geminocystis sp.]|nr:c-type cytochrome biogenesis protein CcsB [Geminocystis sp.]HIK37489.1 c-type cytochrome biogenesis protein CcsB [Geminocystis sp. M7585_C2015_104]MCS7148889.1 c-type cytochrome biogenesis protein CcsB [Geminocystis sp.]MCX8078659.1 c-type cytochrome biogenesis protein CcsB [Geminocystis sp.]MDW8116974.1 c-type cytochrome biogenesis protein CcsB [Geminocystis sp.]